MNEQESDKKKPCGEGRAAGEQNVTSACSVFIIADLSMPGTSTRGNHGD